MLKLLSRIVPGGRARLAPLPGFHGDRHLMALVDHLMAETDWFIETGTHVGTTLAYVARKYPAVRCLSCEIEPNHRAVAEHAVARYPQVTIHPDDAVAFLARLEREHPEIFQERVLFWLDAHGYGFRWPLRDEVAWVTSKFRAARVLIDDFRVPGHPQFGFDEYDGQVCGYEFIRDAIDPGAGPRLWLPCYTEHTSRHHPLRGWCLMEWGEPAFSIPPALDGRMERFDEAS